VLLHVDGGVSGEEGSSKRVPHSAGRPGAEGAGCGGGTR
jgi:hypothetical protein